MSLYFNTIGILSAISINNFLIKDNPKLILLGGVGIIKEGVIRLPEKGVLNSHPGSLPEYRGSYVVQWAIKNNEPIAITVHMVDEGIDTGNIILSQKVDLPKTKSFSYINNYITKLQAENLVLAAKNLSVNSCVPITKTNNCDFPLYSMMKPKELFETYKILWNN